MKTFIGDISWLYLLLAVIGYSAVVLCLKLGSQKDGSVTALTTWIFFSSAMMILIPLARSWQESSWPIGYGICAGVTGSLAVLLLVRALKIGHYGFSSVLLAMSAIVPTLFSIVVWKEPLTVVKTTGIILLFTSMALIVAAGDSAGRTSRQLWIKWFILMTGCFLLNGLGQICQAVVSKAGGNNLFPFLFLFYSSGTVLLLAMTKGKAMLGKGSVVFGTMGGVGSIVGMFFTLKALETFPVNVAFPVIQAGPIIAGAILSRWVFREPIRASGYCGIAIGTISIVILCQK